MESLTILNQQIQIPQNKQSCIQYINNDQQQQIQRKEENYNEWDPRVYLNEYYINSYVTPELQECQQFFHKAYLDINRMMPQGGTLLEFGGGPTLYQLFSAGKYNFKIDFCDYMQSNLDEIELFLKNSNNQYNWDVYAKYLLQLEGVQPTQENIQNRYKQLRKQFNKIFTCDARQELPCGQNQNLYDVVSVNFCIEGITNNTNEWKLMMQKVMKMVKPGGFVIYGCSIGHKRSEYQVGQNLFPVAQISESDVYDLIQSVDLQIKHQHFLYAQDDPENHDYDGCLFTLSRKKQQ